MNIEIERLERMFKALANKKRLLILKTLLESKEMHVGELSEKLNFSVKGVSRNLLILQGAGFLSSKSARNYVKYSIRNGDVHSDNLLALAIVKRNRKDTRKGREATRGLISAVMVNPFLGKILAAADTLMEE